MRNFKMIGLIAIVTIIITIMVALAGVSHANRLFIEKEKYAVDEIVKINLNAENFSDLGLSIQNNQNKFDYLDELKEIISFQAKAYGNHTIRLINKADAKVIDSLEFFVVSKDGSIQEKSEENQPKNEEKAALSIKKDNYFVGDPIVIDILNGEAGNYQITITTQSSSYRLLGSFDQQIKFVPFEAGEHEIRLLNEGKVINSEIISIKDISINKGKGSQKVIRPENYLKVKGKQNKEYQNVKVNFADDDKSLANALSGPEYDIELELHGAIISKLKFNSLRLDSEKEATLRLDEVSAQNADIPLAKAEKILSSFAIDPSGLEFSKGEFYFRAKGSALYKCSEWDFDSEECNGSWQKIMDTRPGKEYWIEISSTDPAFAETGLASINTNKSIYYPGEESKIIIVVLDKDGHLVSDATVNLNVSHSDGHKFFSKENGEIAETSRGIYEASYTNPGSEGNYTLYATAFGINVNSSMISYFSVKEYYDFDIIRKSPVTIDPWKELFVSEIKISSNSQSDIFDFIEVLPPNFTNILADNATIKIADDKITINWSNKGNNSVMKYSAQPPLKTPELYVIGRAEVHSGNGKFVEEKGWFLAIDPVNTGGSASANLTAQACNQENSELNKGTYSESCDTTYPGKCASGIGAVNCNDGISEIFSSGNTNNWGGINITIFNSSGINCQDISTVVLCYEWWASATTIRFCNISIDSEGGTNFSTAVSTCPGITANPGVTCLDITSLEPWKCSTFFGEDNKRAQARVHGQKASGGGARTFTMDALWLNVTYNSDLTNPTISSSINNSQPKKGESVNLTANVADNLNLSFCQFVTNQTANGAKDYFNKTVRSNSDQCSQNFTVPFARGNVINYTVIANDTFGNKNTNMVTITVANTEPPNAIITSPVNDNKTSMLPLALNVTFPSDIDNDALFIQYYINGKLNQTSFVNTSFNASDGIYILNVSLYDNANSSLGNATVNFTVDTKGPAINGTLNKTGSIFLNDIINFSINATDENELVAGQIIVNDTGIKRIFNFSLSARSDQFSQNISVSCFGNCIINFSASVSDSSGNVRINSTIITVFDNIPPRLNASANTTSIKYNEVINFTANVSDEVQLSFCQFIINQSSNGAKEFINKSVNGQNDQCSQNFTISQGRGDVINITVVVNDTYNNMNQSSQLIEVENSLPYSPAIVFPFSDMKINRIPLPINVTFQSDADDDAVTIFYYINGKQNQTSLGNVTLNASDGVYILNVSLFDGLNSSGNATVNFTIDTVQPVINGSRNSSFIRIFDHINASFNLTDETNLVAGMVVLNDTGIRRYFNFSLDSIITPISQNFSVSCGRGCVINITGIANDSAGNYRQNETIFEVNNSISIPAILLPFPDSYLGQQPLVANVTFPADPDNDAVTIYYYINGTFNQSSATNTTINASDGIYWLNVSLFDGLVFGLNATLNFTIDTTAPLINLTTPPTLPNNSFTKSNHIYINVTVNETNFVNITYYIYNSSLNLVNETNFTNQTFSLNITNIIDRNELFIYNVTARDKAGNVLSTDSRAITLDNTPPIVSLKGPANNTVITKNNLVFFEFNVTDDSPIETCALIINEDADVSETDIERNSSQIISKSLSNGFYNWSINCSDAAGNRNGSAFFNISLNVLVPERKYFETKGGIQNSTSGDIINLSLKNDPDSHKVSILAQAGEFKTFVNASLINTSSYGKKGMLIPASTFVSFSGWFDTPDGGIIGYPVWNLTKINSSGKFEICSFISSTPYPRNNPTEMNGSCTTPSSIVTLTHEENLTLSVLTKADAPAKTHNHYYGNRSSFVDFNAYLLGELETDVLSPLGEFTTNETLLFNVTCKIICANETCMSSNLTVESNTTHQKWIRINSSSGNLLLSEGQNPTSVGLVNGSLQEINSTLLASKPSGNNSIRCSGTSDYSNSNGTEVLRVVINDILFPNVSLSSPINGSAEGPSREIFFEYIPRDNNLKNCSLFGNFSGTFFENQTNMSPISWQPNKFTINNLSIGRYIWNVECDDHGNNSNFSSDNFTLLITGDIGLNNSDIIISPLRPVEYDNVTINVTVKNFGEKNETNVTIQFIEKNFYGEFQIESNFSVNITAKNNITLAIDWIAKQGNTTIIVIADPGSAIEEFNELNNRANISIFVGSHHIYYGDIIADIILDNSQNLSVFAWDNDTIFQANIFAVDLDSIINFDRLQPLGRNASGNITLDSLNDFEELDDRLNSTNNSDSINTTWVFEYLPKINSTFIIDESVLNFTPTANSTNSSNFLTGILWDTSDPNPGYYNGTSDVVFISKANKKALGSYGEYDFEIKVPAGLRSYADPGNYNSISILVELK